jgi:hypothetical protein
MWQPRSISTIADPAPTQTIPSRHGIARQAYLDKKRAQAHSGGKASLRFRWALHLGFAL